jgi:heme-degrading monooxygenase HmoA
MTIALIERSPGYISFADYREKKDKENAAVPTVAKKVKV